MLVSSRVRVNARFLPALRRPGRVLLAGAGTAVAVLALTSPALGAVTLIRHDYSVGAGQRPLSVAVADLNADRHPDIITADVQTAGAGGGVSVLMGNGNGTYRPARIYDAGRSTLSVVVADFNGDGRPDLATGRGSDAVAVLLGNGNGTFQRSRTYAVGPSMRSNALAVGDFDGDGHIDLVNADSAFVSVLLGNGDGTFRSPTQYQASAAFAVSVAVGDFDGDGHQDLAVADGNGGVAVLRGNGDGSFTSQAGYAAQGTALAVVVADLDADGRPDLVVANGLYEFDLFSEDFVSVLLGNGDGTFQPALTYDTGASTSPISVAVGDLDGDGHPDLATANQYPGANNASVLLGSGDGTFQPPTTYETGSFPNSIAIGDLNGDGRPDVVTADLGSGDASVLLNKTEHQRR